MRPLLDAFAAARLRTPVRTRCISKRTTTSPAAQCRTRRVVITVRSCSPVAPVLRLVAVRAELWMGASQVLGDGMAELCPPQRARARKIASKSFQALARPCAEASWHWS